MDKTVVVEVEDRVKHALYGKVLRRTSKVKVHDEANAAGVGDLVAHHGDPAAVGHQALARGGDPREGQVSRNNVRDARAAQPAWPPAPTDTDHRSVPQGSAMRTSATTGVRQ